MAGSCVPNLISGGKSIGQGLSPERKESARCEIRGEFATRAFLLGGWQKGGGAKLGAWDEGTAKRIGT